jgi:hypothetical protein
MHLFPRFPAPRSDSIRGNSLDNLEFHRRGKRFLPRISGILDIPFFSNFCTIPSPILQEGIQIAANVEFFGKQRVDIYHFGNRLSFCVSLTLSMPRLSNENRG